MDITVRGRTTGNASELRHQVKVGVDSVLIRIDDNLNDAAWIEVEFTPEQLADLNEELSMLYLRRERRRMLRKAARDAKKATGSQC